MFPQDKICPPERIRHPSAIRELLTKVIHLAVNKYTLQSIKSFNFYLNRLAGVPEMFPDPDRFHCGGHAFGFRVGVGYKRLQSRPFQERVDPAGPSR